jgi:hypothetical protein
LHVGTVFKSKTERKFAIAIAPATFNSSSFLLSHSDSIQQQRSSDRAAAEAITYYHFQEY